MPGDTVTLTLEAGDETDELVLPEQAITLLKESDESSPAVVGDIAMMGFAQRIHGAVHHAEGEPDEAITQLHDDLMEQFEARFGQSFAELTGHSH